jgi:hypothetical protein
MISVKCPACGLVDWNVGNCKRCETPLEGLGAEGDGLSYFRRASEEAAQARAVRTARVVVLACLLVVLALTTLGALYEVHRPAKPQWFWSFYRHEPTVKEIFAHNLEVSGGAGRIARLRSFRAEGRLTFRGGEAERAAEAAGGHVTFVMHAKAPDKIETQIEIGPPAEPETPPEAPSETPSETPPDAPPMALTSYSPTEPPAPSAPRLRLSLRRGFDGSRGWEFVERTILADGSTVPAKQSTSRELKGGELRKLKRYAQTTGLVQLAGEYTSLSLTGREPATWATGGGEVVGGRELPDKALRGHEAYVVSGVNREGSNENLYFDTRTGLLLRVDFEAEDEEGEAVVVACAFSDYREVGGLRLPHRLHFKWGEESMTLTFDKYLPNEFVPDSTFEMPEASD